MEWILVFLVICLALLIVSAIADILDEYLPKEIKDKIVSFFKED